MLAALPSAPPAPSPFDLHFRPQRRAGLFLLIGVAHAAVLLALATWVARPTLALLSTPLAVSLIAFAERPPAQVAEPALPVRAAPLPSAPALPIPVVTPDPAVPASPTVNPEPAATATATMTQAAPAAPDTGTLRLDVPPPAAATPLPRKRLAASAVQYRVMPPAEVPRASRRAGESGTVWLRVLVDSDGVPTSVTVQRSSGFARLDEQALWAMRQARFTPHREDGRPVEVEVIAPIEYPPG